MKKMKSLVLAFAAAAGIGVMGAAPANAQTVPVNGGQVYGQTTSNASVSQGAIDDLAYNVGVQTAYYRDGRGFTQGTASDGETVGLEFQLRGNNATVIRAYNLNDPNSANQFQNAVDNAAANDRYLANQEYSQNTRIYPVYEPQAYVICPPIVPIIGIGWVIGGWYPGYVPHYHHWNGFWDGDHRSNHTTVYNNTTIIERGGRDNGQWHDGRDGRDNGQWRGGHDGRHEGNIWQQGNNHQNNTVIHNNTVVAPPVHRVETPRVETPRVPTQPQRFEPQQRIEPQHAVHQDNGGFRGGMQQTGGAPRGPVPGGHHR